jgi:hypothetical protein
MAAQATIHDKYQSYDACRTSLSAPQLLWQLHHCVRGLTPWMAACAAMTMRRQALRAKMTRKACTATDHNVHCITHRNLPSSRPHQADRM